MRCVTGRPLQTGILPPGTVHLEVPAGEFTLGKPFTMHLTKTGETPDWAFVTQYAWSPAYAAMQNISDGDGLTQVTHGKNGVGSFSLIPIRSGRIQIRVVGFLPCEGMFKEATTVTVKDPIDRPYKFFLSRDDLTSGGVVGLSLDIPTAHQLTPSIASGPSSNPLPLDPHSVRYVVASDRGSQVISVDPSGVIRPVGVGQALVEASFNGAKAYACVVVKQHDKVVGLARVRCESLAPKGVLKQ